LGELLLLSAVSFFVAFVFALGGLGSAVALIPIMVFLGIPFSVARPAGLFTNLLSTLSATVHNLREGLIDFGLALPLLISSLIFAPIGALLSTVVPEKLIALLFSAFLIFAGLMSFLPKTSLFNLTGSRVFPFAVGIFAGLLSGLLGIGGGGLIAPMLIVGGYNPKRVAPITAFVVLFSSLSAFLTYWKLGRVDWEVTLAVALPAAVAGYLGALVSHRFLTPSQIKKVLGAVFIILAVKFLSKFF